MSWATRRFSASYSSGGRDDQLSIQSGVKAWTMWRPSGASDGSSLLVFYLFILCVCGGAGLGGGREERREMRVSMSGGGGRRRRHR